MIQGFLIILPIYARLSEELAQLLPSGNCFPEVEGNVFGHLDSPGSNNARQTKQLLNRKRLWAGVSARSMADQPGDYRSRVSFVAHIDFEKTRGDTSITCLWLGTMQHGWLQSR